MKILLICAFLLIIIFNGFGQSDELGFHVTPVKLTAAICDKDSSIVTSLPSLAISGGLNLTHFFKSGFGIRAGLNLGYMSSKFTLNKSYGKDAEPVNPATLLYQSINLEPIFKFKFQRFFIQTFTGLDLRFFYRNRSSTYALSSVASFGTRQLGDYYQSNIYAGIGYIINSKKQRQFSFSIIKNFGLSNIRYGSFKALPASGSNFQTNFHSVTNSVGIRLQYTYLLMKKKIEAQRDANVNRSSSITKSIFIELDGTGGMISVNYDRRLRPGTKGWGFRAGVGQGMFNTNDNINDNFFSNYISFPVSLNYIIAYRGHGFESGVGVTPEIEVGKNPGPAVTALGTLNLGYRLQPLGSRLLVRMAWTPVYYNKFGFEAARIGLSIGYRLK